MKTFINQYLFSILLLFVSVSMMAQHSIIGDNASCYSECKTYNLSGGVGGPYYWKSTGEIKGTNQGATVEICWNTIGSNNITLVDFSAPIANQVQILNVSVVSIPSPDIIPPKYPTCARKDTLINGGTGENDIQVVECISACSESIGFFGFEENNGASVSWEVDGGTILSTTPDGITIQWNPSGNGFIKLKETNNTGCTDSIFYCVDILEPLDVDILAFNGGPNSISVCAEQEVYLQAIGSQQTTDFEWHMDDGSYDSGANIEVSYSQGGTYDVMLIGASECKCFDTSYYQIIVDSNPGPEITCIGTTCGNDDQTYYAANTCGTYSWNISSNGSISEGGGSNDNYVTVNWNNGPVGSVGLSTSGCSEAVCASETVVQIPILDGTASIDGPAEVCKNGYSNYSIQYYNGTDYTWNITGNGIIISGWNTNQITVEWQDGPQSDNNATISVAYENCYLECGGQASLDVILKPLFTAGHSDLVCESRNLFFSANNGWNGAVVSWTVTSPSGIVTTYPDDSFFNDNFPEIGIHTVTAFDNANTFCNDKIISFFKVVEAPTTPTNIEGPLVICLNEFYNYSVDLPMPGVTIFWKFRDGSIFRTIQSNTASFEWTSNGPYEIEVFYSRDDTYCRSEEFIVVPVRAENTTISGSAMTCEDEVETYSLGATNGSTPEWSIDPSNAGSIIHNPDNTIDVMWHIAGNHQLISDYCGANLIFNVDVAPLGNNIVDYIEEICPGSVTPINITITAGSTIVISDEIGNTVGTSTGVTVPDGKYEVEITSIDGCIEIFPVVIDTFLSPSIRVSSPDENAYCLPYPNLTIVALDTDDGYTYEWFHNNLSMGITTPTISTNQYGGYHVIVTDKNGCTAISNVHRLYEWCEGEPPPGTCPGGGSGPINPDEIYLRCNNLQFTVNGSGMSSTSFTWQFGDPDSGPNNLSNETSPIHEFTTAGYFYVFVQGNIPGENGVDIFAVPAAPRFDYERACAGNETQFRNHSTFIPGFNITGYTWNFGDPSSGADNTSSEENPKHIFTTPGTYSVTLDIESNNGCLSTYELEVIVEPGPFAEFIVPTSACTDDGLLFEAISDPNIYVFAWDFDDPSSGAANNSRNQYAIHTFSNNGIYNVSLSVSDGFNCIKTIIKPVEISTTTLSGDISANKLLPMCFGEEVTLTAPSGGSAYIWSDGSIGQSITVSDPKVYSVTISDNSGCHYVPKPINVSLKGLIDDRIRATHLTDNFFGTNYYDSLEICHGELFSLRTTYISNATYEWSTGHTSHYISENDLTGFSPGRHEFKVTINNTFSGCVTESKPLIVIIHALPDVIQISSSTVNPCEGELHTLTIDNPDPSLIYYWSNGKQGYQTTVYKGGNYTVTAKNKNGCERESAGIYVSPVPNANRINIGCMEACFPDTICIPTISGAAGYQWLLNGSPMPGANGNSSDLIADQAGEYQLIVVNYNGCSDTSNILSIEAEPSDQSISGIVFIDDNNNGIWDVGEELLAGVPVNLMMGNVIESTILTDMAGYYNFDPVLISNPRIEIDTTGLGLNLTGGLLEDDIDFIDCLEDKEKDFPLIRECSPSNENLELFTCKGETIILNSIVLQEGDTWTFDDLNSAGCDSSTQVIVFAFPEADVNLTTNQSCQDINNGSLDIAIMAGSGLLFAVDNNSSYTTNLQFSGLAPGNHMLWLTDENGCIKNYSFEIEAAQTPQMNTVAQNTCINANSGIAEIIPTVIGNYQYSLDGITFTTNTIFTDLAVGAYIIYVQEDNNCIYQYPFVIAANPEPQFDLVTGKSCSTGANGTLEVLPLSGGTYTYSLDNITFSNNSLFENLAIGTSLLYVQELDGCTHIYPFEILPKEFPLINITTQNTCVGENQGSILIIPTTTGDYQFSLDGVTFTNDLEFLNLGEGMHNIYLLEDSECQIEFAVEIFSQPTPSITLDTEDACIGESNGSVLITTTEFGLQFSLDQITFTTENNFENLSVGLHTIYIISDNGCIHPFDFEIMESDALDVDFIDPILDCNVEIAELSPIIHASRGEVQYTWNTGSTDSTLIVDESGQYTLKVSDKCSEYEYTWDIQLADFVVDQPIYFPNIFSPNQDGINECFLPVLGPKTIILDYRLIIFDRWGNKYFESTDINDCWDGKFNGKEARTGVFVYLLEMDYTYCVEVESLKKYGDVTIVY